jgi:hypothetical protein
MPSRIFTVVGCTIAGCTIAGMAIINHSSRAWPSHMISPYILIYSMSEVPAASYALGADFLSVALQWFLKAVAHSFRHHRPTNSNPNRNDPFLLGSCENYNSTLPSQIQSATTEHSIQLITPTIVSRNRFVQ